MNTKKSSRVSPSLRASAYRLRRIPLLILGLGATAFAPAAWADTCVAANTSLCSAPGGINSAGSGGDGGAGNGQGGGSSVIAVPLTNLPGALGANGVGGAGATASTDGGTGGGGGPIGSNALVLTDIIGGAGGAGQSGTSYSGGGGGGGAGLYANPPTLDITAATPSIVGGQGGAGGNTTTSTGVAGGGGGGGAGLVVMAPTNIVANHSLITGGQGGAGGNSLGGTSSEGGGGGGGVGVLVLGDGGQFTNSGTITGGIGGAAGTGGGNPARSGDSGAGVVVLGNNQLLTNMGTIVGSDHSAGGIGVAGAAGAAVVIYGDNATVLNYGNLQGGLQADGSFAPAIDVEGKDNTIRLTDSGWSATGDLFSGGSNNALQLGPLTGTLDNTIKGFSRIVVLLADASWTLNGAILMTQPLELQTNLGDQLLLTGNILGSESLAANGAGTVTLTGTNFYTGSTTISGAGTLALAGVGTLGTSGLSMSAGSTFDVSQSSFNAISIPFLDGDASTTLRLGSRNVTLGEANTNFTFGGVIADGGISNQIGGSITVNAPGGSVTFADASSTYTGGTTITAGTLMLTGAGSLAAAGAVNVGPSGTFDISGLTATGTAIGDLSGGGAVTLGGKSLTIDGAHDTVMSGVISGAGSLIKQGNGALVLTGVNTYAGETTLQGGSLYVGNTIGAPSKITGNVHALSGTTLGGYGVIGGSVDVANGAHVAPGTATGMGTLTVGNLTMAQGSQLDFGFGTPGSPLGLSDHIAVLHNLELDGVTLNVNDVGSFGPGLYNLFTYSNLAENNGGITLGSSPPGAVLSVQHLVGQIDLLNGSGSPTLDFWNANGLASASRLGGGTGTWSATSLNWADSTGSVTAAMQPQPGFAIFGGTPGRVTVDISSGAVQATGIQFDSDGYVLDGGTLTLVDPAHHPVEVRVGDGSAASMGWTATLGNVIAGTDGLAKTGAGTLLLTGVNTYTGGTSIQAGILSVDSDARLGAAAGALALDGGTLRVTGTAFKQTARAVTLGNNGGGLDIADASNIFTLDQALSGNGGLNKLGAGTLLMTADNTYTGATTISGGTLQLGNGGNTGGISGDVVNNGTLVFNRADAVTFAGAMSGSGNMLQAGPGSLTLTGDSSAFAGAGNVAAGTLVVDGKLGGTLSVARAATLAGTGTVGSTALAGGSILAPGNGNNSIGTLTVNGNLSFAPGTTYQVQADPAGTASDLVHVTGVANLAGSVIHVGSDGNFAPLQTYTILTADGGVTGTFDSVASSYTFLTPTLTYDPNDTFLTLKRNSTSFASSALTKNQRAVAGALDGMLASAALPSAVSTVAAAQAPSTFDGLSGEIHPSTTSVLQSISQNVASMPLDHLRNSLGSGSLSGQATAQLDSGDSSPLIGSAEQPVWAQVFGNWRTLSGNSNTAQVRESDGGLFVGADRDVAAGWRLGGALGYTGSHSSINDRSSTSNVDSYSASIYGGKAFQAGPGKINLMLGTAYTWNDIHTKRDVDAAGLDQTLKANYGASTGQVFGELGYALPLNDNFTLEPFAGAAYSNLRTRGFSESDASGSSGDSAALDGKSNTNDVTTTTLGLHARTAFAIQETQGHLNATVGWRHAFGDVKPETTMAFDGSQTFTVAGAPLARDAAVLQLGADVAVTKNTTVGVAYSGQYGAGNQQNSGSVNVSWRF